MSSVAARSPRRSWRQQAAAIGLLFAMAAAPPGALAQTASAQPQRRNWFDDPFIVLSQALPGCPEPTGPRITEAERRVQSHHRAERGTTCFLSGQCKQPNAYADDAAIAETIRRQWPAHPELARSSLWLTVQAGVVYFEGCVADRQVARQLERLALAAPSVRQALAIVMAPGEAPPPYPVWPGGR